MSKNDDAEVYASHDYFIEPVDGERTEKLPHFDFVFGYPKDDTESVWWGV